MLDEDTELDTLALISIRNMIDVSIILCYKHLTLSTTFFRMLSECQCYLLYAGLRYPKTVCTCTYTVILSIYALSVQVPMCIVAPGKQPRTEAERALSTSSGHIIHLMPGDHQYDPCSFCVVLVWNGINHYIPSYLMKHSSILQYRCSVISKCLSTATNLFSDIESDLDDSKDEELIEQFHRLRDHTIQAQHLLAIRGLEAPKLPPTTAGPDPRDTASHLTRKTPLPLHPEPLISHALTHSLDPDSAIKRVHPTPHIPPPPEEIEKKDFTINPSDYETDEPRCVKTAGMRAPGKLLATKQSLLVSIPLPLDPTEGHPPAKPQSIGAKRFKKDSVEPASQTELLDMVQDQPYNLPPNRPPTPKPVLDKDGLPPRRIAQKPVFNVNVDVDVDVPPHRITQKSSEKPRITLEETITSETVEQKTEYGDQQVSSSQRKGKEDKIKSLKRKVIPSGRSPRVSIPKLDLSKGIKSSLRSQERSAVESIAKNVVKSVVSNKPLGSKDRSSSSASSSSQSSGSQGPRQKKILEMYAQAALRITRKPKPSASQGSASQDVEVLPLPPPVSRVSSVPPPRIAQLSQPPPRRIAQSSQLVQPVPQPLPPVQRITQAPVPARRITQADPTKGPVLSCTYCKYTTFRKESLLDHLKMHTGEKIKCDQCDKSYFSKKALKTHFKAAHLKVDRCLCTEVGCNWSGKDYGNRKVHLYEEHGIGEPPVCDHPDCRDRGHFSNFRTLERHRETYHKPRDLTCPYCYKKYKDAENMANHVSVHHRGEGAFQCEICGSVYTSKKSLLGHKKEHD